MFRALLGVPFRPVRRPVLMPTYRLDLAYDGTGFRGYARQDGQRTVQGELESALGHRPRGCRSSTTVAGRTDAGVHARGQVVSFDVEAEIDGARVGTFPERHPGP